MLVKGGKSQSLEEFVEYNCDEDKIKWTSSDANVATVNAHGENYWDKLWRSDNIC